MPSLYLHPSEALHGDLGRVNREDVVLALSNSGSTEELFASPLAAPGAQVVAITGDGASPLARGADVVLDVGAIPEACPLGLVPTASSAALHAVSDALAMTLLKTRQFSSEEYAALHPGGKLGRSVMRVLEVMRAGRSNPVPGQRSAARGGGSDDQHPAPGATSVVDDAGRLVGIFTDGDLRRLISGARPTLRPGLGGDGSPSALRLPEIWCSPRRPDAEAHVDQLPVVDADGRPVGLIDVQDLLAARLSGLRRPSSAATRSLVVPPARRAPKHASAAHSSGAPSRFGLCRLAEPHSRSSDWKFPEASSTVPQILCEPWCSESEKLIGAPNPRSSPRMLSSVLTRVSVSSVLPVRRSASSSTFR